MTKKTYETIAKVVNRFKETSVSEGDKIDMGHVENLIDMLSIEFAQDNPLFKEEKFKEACLTGKHIRKSIKN